MNDIEKIRHHIKRQPKAKARRRLYRAAREAKAFALPAPTKKEDR